MPPRRPDGAPLQRRPAPGRQPGQQSGDRPGSRPGPQKPPAPSQPVRGTQPGAGPSKTIPPPTSKPGNSSTAKASSPPASPSSTPAGPTPPKSSASSPGQTAIAAPSSPSSAHGQTDAASTTPAPSAFVSTTNVTLPNGSVSTSLNTVSITTNITTNSAGGLETATSDAPNPTTSSSAFHPNRTPAIVVGVIVGLLMLVTAVVIIVLRSRRRLRHSPPPPMRTLDSSFVASRPGPRASRFDAAADPFAGSPQAWPATEDGADVAAPGWIDSDALSSSDLHFDGALCPSDAMRAGAGVRLSQFEWHPRTPSPSDGGSLAATDDFNSPPPSPRLGAAPGSTGGQSVAVEDGHPIHPR